MTNKTQKFDSAATLACLGVIACWTAGPIFIKLLAEETSVWNQNFLRYLVACLFWLPMLIAAFRKGVIDRSIWKFAALPALANTIMQVLWAATFYYLDPTFANLISKSTILFVAVFSLIFFPQERSLLKSKQFWIGAIFAIIGVIGVLVFHSDFGSKTSTLGIIFCLGSAIMWGVYIIIVKIAFKNTDVRYGFSVISIYTTIGLFVLALCFGDISEAANLTFRPWLYIIVSSLLSIAISHVLFYFAIKRIGAIIPSLSLLVTPFTIFLFSIFIFDEKLCGKQYIFGIILLAGAALAIYSQKYLRTKQDEVIIEDQEL